MTNYLGISPNNPRDYVGPDVALVPCVTRPRRPTVNDIANTNGKKYKITTIWQVGENPSTGVEGEIWILTSYENGQAIWLNVSSGSSGPALMFVTDNGTATPNGSGVVDLIARNFAGGSVLFSQVGHPSNTVVLTTTDGLNNTFIGQTAGNSTLSGTSNTSLGFGTLNNLTSGIDNTTTGYGSLNAVTTGQFNTCSGHLSGNTLTTGSENTLFGDESGSKLTTGSFNTLIGASAGLNYTSSESSNINLGNEGIVGESNVIRVGTQGSGSGQQNECFIAGIIGNTVSNQELVMVNSSTGQMGVQTYTIGSWTPTLTGSTTAGTTTYSAQSGSYTQIGNIVTIVAAIIITNATGTGNVVIGGLPVPIGGLSMVGTITLSSSAFTWPTSTTQMVVVGTASSSTLNIVCTGSGTTQALLQMANGAASISITMTYKIT